MPSRVLHAAALAILLCNPIAADSSGPFINWETPQVSPLALTPDGTRLLAVNTADNRLEVFSVATGVPVRTASIPVGLDPVSVRSRSNTEAWVVNHISDSISIVNLTTLTVTATLRTLDEPCDVVFARPASGQRAFVTCSQANTIQVFQTANLQLPAAEVAILGEEPRALAVSADGLTVYAAIFESGNHSTILGGGGVTNIAFPPNVVTNPIGPYGGVNPPPNSGAVFNPPVAVVNPPRVGLIVKKNVQGQWMDDNAHDWSAFVSGANAGASGRPTGWDLYDNDLAVIDAATLTTTYATGIMNICMGLAVNPSSGQIAVIGTDATNQVRFEPVVKGKFLRVNFASVNPSTLASTITDLNPHLNYTTSTVSQTLRNQSIGDPRGIAWLPDGQTAFITGMGSNNVISINGSGVKTGQEINVGQGPTGIVHHASSNNLFVLNRFDASISTINPVTRAVISTLPFFDPTPAAIKVGRRHLYNTHDNSGLGQIACASCHVDARLDRLAWDLGDPQGASVAVSTANRNLGQNLVGLAPGSANPAFAPYHPMKGPMTTQTLQDIIGKEPHHWRGDRLGLEEFNGAFITLQGDDANLNPAQMQEFEDFLATITFPPNPFRNFDNTLPASLPLPGHFTTGRFGPAGSPLPNGNAINGLAAYRSQTMRLDNGAFSCVTCHTLPTGAGTDMRMSGPVTPPYLPITVGSNGEHHLQLVSVDGVSNVTMKTAQLRNLYEKTGMNFTQNRNTAGFGVLHDGSVDSIERFISEPVFTLTSDQMVADITAFLLAFSGSDLPAGSTTSPLEPPGPPSKDTHAAVGWQTTAAAAVDTTLISSMITQANTGKVGLIAKGLINNTQRGFAYAGANSWQSDAAGETYTTSSLTALASASSPITFTVVPVGSQTRIGIDRDSDGFFDRDETRVCSDPANPDIRPGTPRSIDINGDLAVTVQDIFDFLGAYFTSAADFNADGSTTVQDIFDFLNVYFSCPRE